MWVQRRSGRSSSLLREIASKEEKDQREPSRQFLEKSLLVLQKKNQKKASLGKGVAVEELLKETLGSNIGIPPGFLHLNITSSLEERKAKNGHSVDRKILPSRGGAR